MDGSNSFLLSLAQILSSSRYQICFGPSSQKRAPISNWQDYFLHGLQGLTIKTWKEILSWHFWNNISLADDHNCVNLSMTYLISAHGFTSAESLPDSRDMKNLCSVYLFQTLEIRAQRAVWGTQIFINETETHDDTAVSFQRVRKKASAAWSL